MNVIKSLFFINGNVYLPKGKDIKSSHNIKISGYASVFFKTLFSVGSLAISGKVVSILIAANQIYAAAAAASVGLFILLKIVNYSLGTRIIFLDGEIQEGVFNKEGCLVKGKVIIPNDQVQEGTYEGDIFTGKVTYKSGRIEEGVFHDRLTEGTITYPNRQVEMGTFNKDGFLIDGTIKCPDGTVIVGKLIENDYTEGKITYPDRRVEEGIFDENGILIKTN